MPEKKKRASSRVYFGADNRPVNPLRFAWGRPCGALLAFMSDD